MSDYVTKQELRAVLEAAKGARKDMDFAYSMNAALAALDAQPEQKACAGFYCGHVDCGGPEVHFGTADITPCVRCGLPFAQHAPASAEPQPAAGEA